MKELLKDLLIATLTAFAIPLAIYIGLRVTGLKNVASGTFKLGQRLSAPAVQGGRNVSGRIAHWGSGRGVVGRTVARVATGAVFVGGRRSMERTGEQYRKGSVERMVARGMYRIQPSGKMNAELLEKVTPDAIAKWVNSDDPNTRKAVEQLRQMVLDTPAIKLSTAQRKALFSGGGLTPGGLVPTGPPAFPGGPPTMVPATSPTPGMPTPLGAPPTSIAGAPPGVASLPAIDSARESRVRWGSWLSSNERPPIAAPLRLRGQNAGRWLMGHAASWGGWVTRPVRGGAAPASPAPMPGVAGGPPTMPSLPSPPPGGPGYRP